MFVFHKDCKGVGCEPGVTRKVLAYSEELMMCEVSFEKGARGNVHSHEHRQITYIAKGSFLFMIDGKEEEVHTGDSVYMSGNAVHGVTCLEEGILVDVFTPVREDFLK